MLGPVDQLPVSYRTLGTDVKTMQGSFATWLGCWPTFLRLVHFPLPARVRRSKSRACECPTKTSHYITVNRSDSRIDGRIDNKIELTSFRRHSMSSGGFDSLLLICLLLSVQLHLSGFAAENAQRIRPPERITCSRDHLTSYTGKVLSMKRQRGSTRIRMRTDEETRSTSPCVTRPTILLSVF